MRFCGQKCGVRCSAALSSSAVLRCGLFRRGSVAVRGYCQWQRLRALRRLACGFRSYRFLRTGRIAAALVNGPPCSMD